MQSGKELSDTRKIPSCSKSNGYKELISYLVSINDEKETMTDLAHRLNVSRDTVYRSINHEYTKQMIADLISALSIRDCVLFYENLRERGHDPRMSRLWYDIFGPKRTKQYPTVKIIINMAKNLRFLKINLP
ncbi:MAG: hypothetical protein ACFE9R_02005 [Candidatus Hermodarchaeota archaeon]